MWGAPGPSLPIMSLAVVTRPESSGTSARVAKVRRLRRAVTKLSWISRNDEDPLPSEWFCNYLYLWKLCRDMSKRRYVGVARLVYEMLLVLQSKHSKLLPNSSIPSTVTGCEI